MSKLQVGLVLLVTVAQSLCGEVQLGNFVEPLPVLPPPQQQQPSGFKKFLNLFGIGTGKQLNGASEYPQSYPQAYPYGYPCQVSTTTTTTPSPVMLTPMLCPFPPVVPNSGDGKPLLPLPIAGNVDDLPPTPPVVGHHGHIFMPEPMPGMPPQPIFPTQPHLPFPVQPIQPLPVQTLPQPIQNLPNSDLRPLPPTVVTHSLVPSASNVVTPVVIDPAKPDVPVKVNPVVPKPLEPIKVSPVVTKPLEPVKVNPTVLQPSKPLQVSPVNVDPSVPMFVEPVQPGKPILIIGQPMDANVNPGQPLFVGSYGPMVMDPKGFSKLPLPDHIHGLANVVINPGLPPVSDSVPVSFPPGKVPHFDMVQPPIQSNSIGVPDQPRYPHLDIVYPQSFLPTGNILFSPAQKPDLPPSPLCSNPNLRPYVPPGFHLPSVNQYVGLVQGRSPPSEIPPCSTLDMLTKLEFKIMRSLIVSSGLLPLFDQTRNYTLFVPSDAAFRRLPRWFRDSLEVDAKLKKALVLNHLVKEDLPLSLLVNEELVLSARPGANRLRVNVYQPESSYRTFTVDGSEVEKGDILTTQGRLHIVQKVLIPNLPRNAAQFISEKLEFEGFWNLVKQAEMVQAFQELRPFTLFIPVNEAVKRLNDSSLRSDVGKLRNFINYHIVNGTYYSSGLINNEFLLTNYEKEIKVQVFTDGFARALHGINGKVRILKSDITLTNGVAHIIEQCISEETPFYIYPQSDEFTNEYGVMRRSFRITGEEKNIENAF